MARPMKPNMEALPGLKPSQVLWHQLFLLDLWVVPVNAENTCLGIQPCPYNHSNIDMFWPVLMVTKQTDFIEINGFQGLLVSRQGTP